MSATRVFAVCLDTLGDLVLRQPLLSGLLDEGFEVRILVRTPYAALMPFLDPRLSLLATDLDPYRVSDETPAELSALREQVLAEKPDLFVSCAYTRSLAEEWLLRSVEGLRTAAFTSTLARPTRAALAILLPDADLETPARVTLPVSATEHGHETIKNAALGAAILGRALPEREPALTLPPGVRADAESHLGTLGLVPGRYVLGCPGGTANNRLKAWPVESYAEQVAHLQRRHGLPVLLTGLPGEAAHMEAVAQAAAARGTTARVHVGEPDQLPLLLGLVSLSRLYLGTDTGPMHFAGALGVPVVAAFGGGHWPRFLPRARRSFVATRDLPCFGCGWECWLEEPACITAIDPDVVREGIDWILGDGPDERRVHRGSALEPAADRVVRSALAAHRSREQAWREARERLDRDAEALLAYTRRLQEDGAARLEAMERMGLQVQELAAAHARDIETLTTYIRRLEEDSAARLDAMERMGRQVQELEKDSAARLRNMETLSGIIDGQQAILSRRSVKLLRLLRLA